MTNDHIDVEIVDDDDVVAVHVHGEIDLASAPQLDATLDQFAAHRSVVVDMAGVQFIDSTGLNVILAQYTRMREAGGSLRIRRPSAPVSSLLRLTSFEHLVEAETTLEASP